MDLSPGYRELAPPAPLADSIRCFWVRVTGPGGDGLPGVLPDACADLIWQAGRGAFIAGPDTGPAPAGDRSGAVFVGARFAPGAGGAALGIPLSELRDQRPAAEVVLPALRNRLPGDLPPEEAARELVRIAGGLAAAGGVDRAVAAAARELERPGARVDDLPDRLGLSERQLRRRTHAAAGYGPKTLQRIVRFQRWLGLTAAAGAEPDLARLALEAGYADQAHLTNECRRLSGLPPARLVRARHGAGRQRAGNGIPRRS